MAKLNKTILILVLTLVAVSGCFAEELFTFGAGAGFQHVGYDVESDLEKYADRNTWGLQAQLAYYHYMNGRLSAGPRLSWEMYSFKEFRSYNHIKLSADVRFTFLSLAKEKLELSLIAGPGLDFGVTKDGLKAFYPMVRAGIGATYSFGDKLGLAVDILADMTIQEGSKAFNTVASVGISYRYGKTVKTEEPAEPTEVTEIPDTDEMDMESTPGKEPEGISLVNASDGSVVIEESMPEVFEEETEKETGEETVEPELVVEDAEEDEGISLPSRPCTETGDHKYGKWEIIVRPTCTKYGVATHTCVDCGHIEPVKLPKTDHVSGRIEYNNVAHWHICEVCGIQYGIEDHDFVDGLCSICGYKGGQK